MKFNGEVDLRQRARRKWFVLLACLLVAGGWWYRTDQQKKRAEAGKPLSEKATKASASATDTPFLIDEAVASSFSAPALALGETGQAGFGVTNRDKAIDYSRPVVIGLNQTASVPASTPWLGHRSAPAATPIALSTSEGGFKVEPGDARLVPPQIPNTVTPIKP
jgi:hypothetical protein